MSTEQEAAVLRNAQALELYLRINPATGAYVDCMQMHGAGDRTQLELHYEKFDPGKGDMRLARKCDRRFSDMLKQVERRMGSPIEVSSADVVAQADDRDQLMLNFRLDISNPALGDVLLGLAAEEANGKLSRKARLNISVAPEALAAEACEAEMQADPSSAAAMEKIHAGHLKRKEELKALEDRINAMGEATVSSLREVAGQMIMLGGLIAPGPLSAQPERREPPPFPSL